MVYIFLLLQKNGYRRYTSFELRQDIDAKQKEIVSQAKSVSSQQIHCIQTDSLHPQIHCNTDSLPGGCQCWICYDFQFIALIWRHSYQQSWRGQKNIVANIVNIGVGPVAQQSPSLVCRYHPHTMGNDAYARLCVISSGAWAISHHPPQRICGFVF